MTPVLSIATSAVTRQRSVVLAGGITVFLGAFHLIFTALMNVPWVPAWFTGELWFPANGMTDLPPAQGAFWLVIGSFGVPLICLGLLVGWLGRRGVVPPAFIAWTLGAWGTLGGVIFVPAGFPAIWVPVIMLLLAVRRAGEGRTS